MNIEEQGCFYFKYKKGAYGEFYCKLLARSFSSDKCSLCHYGLKRKREVDLVKDSGRY